MDTNNVTILSTCIAAIVTILGFVVTYFLNKRNLEKEVQKQKLNLYLEKMADLPYKILALMDTILDKENSSVVASMFKEIISLIFSYGSKDAIILVSRMQEVNYTLVKEPYSVDKIDVIAYYILLVCQVKYDLTEIAINPQYWYRMRLPDYLKMKQLLNNSTNKIVAELGLSSFLRVE